VPSAAGSGPAALGGDEGGLATVQPVTPGGPTVAWSGPTVSEPAGSVEGGPASAFLGTVERAGCSVSARDVRTAHQRHVGGVGVEAREATEPVDRHPAPWAASLFQFDVANDGEDGLLQTNVIRFFPTVPVQSR
jgi:hypothetical protein